MSRRVSVEIEEKGYEDNSYSGELTCGVPDIDVDPPKPKRVAKPPKLGVPPSVTASGAALGLSTAQLQNMWNTLTSEPFANSPVAPIHAVDAQSDF